MKQANIVVVGGGIAGLEIASSLGRKFKSGHANSPLISVLDRDSAHIWKPMLHTIAAGTRDISQQQTTYAAQARDCGFAYQPGELNGLDRASKQISIAALYAPDGRLLIPERTLPYDKLILAVGSQANDFGTPGVQEHCYMIDSRVQADAFNREVRLRMFQCLGLDQELSIAIVGGGATGVELAAELTQLAEIAESYGAVGLGSKIHITLIQSGPRLLDAFPESISQAVREKLEALGIKVLTNTRVQSASADGLNTADGNFIPAAMLVWAAGVKAAEVMSQLDGLECNRNNQLIVNNRLQTTLDDSIYAVGDCASLTLPGATRALPPTAQVAHQQAVYLIRHFSKILNEQKFPDFRYRNLGALVALGEYDAYASLGQFGLFKNGFIRGKIAQLSHAMLYRSHQSNLHGFWRGSLLWMVDQLNKKVRPSIRLD
ncbi:MULTISPECIES: NAD(P)/FAD-dependent oxidoreductase [Oxalobacteraceae]|uniref:NAD(P)/FAD-dependent oxidoreductase n=1 Tax=Herminiimonas sp. Marseille-P9896 TaxID=2742211 RepID=UPI0015888DC3|nr:MULTISPECIES: NAD(P)/FAD-dependent oxidoreductase [Oxalobacteraceae]